MKKHHPTAKQIAAAKKWAQAGAAVHKANVAAKKAGKPLPAKWSPNTDVACCAVEALAASLRLTGRPVADADILELYWRITGDPDAGATIETAARAAAEYGLGGIRLLGARPAARLGDGVVLGVDLRERHAVTLDRRGVWSWGRWRPVSAAVLASADEAWELQWAGAVA